MPHPSRRAVLAVVPAAFVAAGVRSVGAQAATSLPQQSPVAINSATLRRGQGLAPLRLSYARSVALSLSYISNDGLCGVGGPEESVRATVPAGSGTATLGSSVYELKQFHFHTPAEHTVDGVRYPVEQHFVHADAAGRLLVLGVFLRPARDGGPVDRVLAELPLECGPSFTVPGVDLSSLVESNPTVVRYSGSLTTAPYTEGVNWNVVPRPKGVSAASIRRLQGLFPQGDSRELQPLDGRDLVLVRGHGGDESE